MDYYDIHYINQTSANASTCITKGPVPYIQCMALKDIDFIRHGFSTRLGGVSTGIYESMNLNFERGDDSECVQENFRRIAKAIGTIPEHMVYSMQTHTTNVIRVGKDDCGNGVTRPQQFRDVDGLITNESEVCLVTTYADCVPLYFVDVKRHAIGLSHSGWRGTAGRIGLVTIQKMTEEFGSSPQDIITFIGPSICGKCYEVSEDVAGRFRQQYRKEQWDEILKPKETAGKYELNLHRANQINMLEAGILEDNIYTTDICTCCNPQLLFSHRASAGRRGGLCAFLEIK